MHNELRDYIDPPATSLTHNSGPRGSTPRRASPLDVDHILVTNGVSSALEHCAWALANPGDGILLGRPYYRSFLADISLRTGVNVVPVSFGASDPLSEDCVPLYEKKHCWIRQRRAYPSARCCCCATRTIRWVAATRSPP
jgi:histidinol-phosphate/aromatic aminotransferase/cobyric acid decarboxylase-like protein